MRPFDPQRQGGAHRRRNCAAAGIAEEKLLVLPHPQVVEYVRRNANDYDRWLAGKVKLRKSIEGAGA